MKTKDGKVIVGIETEFNLYGYPHAGEEEIFRAMLKLYSRLTDIMNGGLIDEYNEWFSKNVFDGDMSENEKMLVLYDAGLSAWSLDAANGRYDLYEYLGSEWCYELRFKHIDIHTGTYLAMDEHYEVFGIQMKLGKMRTDLFDEKGEK